MAERWLDLPGADRVELDDVAREVVADYMGTSVKTSIEELVEALQGKDEEDKHGRFFAGLLKSLVDRARDALTEKPAGDLARLLVDELGRRGWEILPPATVRRVKVDLRLAGAFRQSRLPEALASVKLAHGPRVKKLKSRR